MIQPHKKISPHLYPSISSSTHLFISWQEEEKQRLIEELQEAKDQARRRSLGNIKFIGELFKLKMLTEVIMHDCIVKLLKNHDEESLECLCRLLSTIGKDLDFEKAKVYWTHLAHTHWSAEEMCHTFGRTHTIRNKLWNQTVSCTALKESLTKLLCLSTASHGPVF